MAHHNVLISAMGDPEIGDQLAFSPSTQNSPQSKRDIFAPNDTVSFKYEKLIGGGSAGSLTVNSFHSSFWTSNSNVVLSLGQTTTKTVKSTASGNGTVGCSKVGFSSATHYFFIEVDDTPNSFVFGDVTAATLSTYYYSNTITVGGLGGAVTAKASNGHISINGGGWVTSGTVSNGSTVRARIYTGGSYNTVYTNTITIGDLADAWTVKTKINPTPSQVINFPITSGSIGLAAAVKAFFGGDGILSQYLRGGSFVPNITKNNAVPTVKPISLSQLRGSGTTLYWNVNPSGKFKGVDTTSGAIVCSLYWALGADYSFGYGDIAVGLEYRLTITESTGSGLITGAVFTRASSTWSSGNTSFGVSYSFPSGGNEQRLSGSVKIEVRHKLDPATVITDYASYQLSSFGK